MPVAAPQRRVIDTYQTAVIQLADTVTRLVDTAWTAQGGLTDTEAEAFVRQVVPIVRGAQGRTADLAVTYIANYLRTVGVTPDDPGIDTAVLVDGLRNGTDPAVVYHRAVVAARVAVSEGATYAEAMDIGRARAIQTADTDVKLASRAGAHAAMDAFTEIVGYRRIPDPGACRYCLLASTQRYKVRDLMPLHPACGCSVAPIVGTQDPGQVIDKDLLDKLNAEAATVREHGELGPVLVPKGQHFKGPAQVN